MPKGTLIAVGGPTASGKTAAAIAIAKKLNTEIISADSRQFYAEMSIGTARPTPDEMKAVRHHFVGHLNVTDHLSAGAFADQALPVVIDLLERTGYAVVVGGSGLYMDALCYGLDDLPRKDAALREELNARLNANGLEDLVKELSQLDPASIDTIDIQNPHRVMRAIEVSRISGKPFSSLKKGRKVRPEFALRKLAMAWDREILYQRINKRVDMMITQGLEDEVRSLLPYRNEPTLNTVGYKELFTAFDGNCSIEEAIEKIKQHTRNYAKRQLTWMRRDADWEWISPTELAAHALMQA